MTVPQPLPENLEVLTTAVDWLLGALLGTFGTSVAIIAVALVGYQAIFGHIPVRRAASVILGCFIFFGAPKIVAGVMSVAEVTPAPAVSSPPVQSSDPVESSRKVPASVDPYAGATAPQ